MLAATDTPATPNVQPLLRVVLLVLGGAAVAFWIVVARASVADALPLAKGVRLGLCTTLTFLLLVWPGMILGICTLRLRAAAALIGLALAIDAAIYLAYLPAYLPRIDGTVALLFAALLAVGLGTFWLFGWPRQAAAALAATRGQSAYRLLVLYVAGLGHALWLSGFAYPIEVWSRGRGDGFEVIPVFYGTIFYLAFVLPLTVIGLNGSQERHETATRVLMVLTLAVALIFGLPQLLG